MFFFNLEKKSKVLLSQEIGGDEQPGAEASRSVVLVGVCGGAALAPGDLVSAGEGAGRAACQWSNRCPVKACWYFLWLPGAALSSKRVSGMLEAGV